MTVISGKENVDRARLVFLKSALSLEVKGMKKRGRSAYAIVKEELGFTGSKQGVLDQLIKHIKDLNKPGE